MFSLQFAPLKGEDMRIIRTIIVLTGVAAFMPSAPEDVNQADAIFGLEFQFMGNKSRRFAHAGLALAKRCEIGKSIGGNFEIAIVRLLGIRQALCRLTQVFGR